MEPNKDRDVVEARILAEINEIEFALATADEEVVGAFGLFQAEERLEELRKMLAPKGKHSK